MTVWFVIRKKNNDNKIKDKLNEPSPAVNAISSKTKKQTYRSKLTQRNNANWETNFATEKLFWTESYLHVTNYKGMISSPQVTVHIF